MSPLERGETTRLSTAYTMEVETPGWESGERACLGKEEQEALARGRIWWGVLP